MQLSRVILHHIGPITHRDDWFEHVDQTPYAKVCLRGLNGSGKTFYLQAILGVWHCFLKELGKEHLIFTPLPGNEWLIAIRISDYTPQFNFWLVCGNEDLWKAVPNKGDFPVIAWFYKGNQCSLSTHKATSVLKLWKRKKLELPQIVSIDPTCGQAFGTMSRLYDIYSNAHVSGLPEKWETCVSTFFHHILTHLPELGTKVDISGPPSSWSISFSKNQKILEYYQLSKGEKNTLTMLCCLSSAPKGSVILLDNPEDSRHISCHRSDINYINLFVKSIDGQLITASHSPDVWDDFRVNGKIIDL